MSEILFGMALAAIGIGIGVAPAWAQQTPDSSEGIWQGLKGDVFGDRSIGDANGVVSIQAPKRAEDAALVPIGITIDPARAPQGVIGLTLVIDANPSPVAAIFKIGKDAGVTHIATRVRVNDYSYVRVIAETPDGGLHMAKSFVKASGGCSAPAVKNMDEALKTMGQMKLRQFAASQTGGKQPELQLMIRHPNNSGLQRDPLTQYFIPAHFIQTLDISQGSRPLMSMEGGISISEDPNFRFDYKVIGTSEIKAQATDTKGKTFNGAWLPEANGM
ncbi:quinoprotein dehydrogenase-associated SoxYZ-like carrier [Mesorhizobium sp. SP-1A]|uniref:quinoprotein dehydrogenase-associated SoxYZ-like carrier n=1 Tax=Mesorhizobium sp. SP-1A TaxID=3077840 RepID=UPI0028F6F55D|nr:quinoprotein dehydrogenase-associated SoxYZ-like carrier [Mesorhizobium sp. SP-1A]